jgi:hypothetical protein
MLRSFLVFYFFALCFISSQSFATDVAEKSTEELTDELTKEFVELIVIDSYLEMHSGPGRGYPIIHTMEQDEPITVLRRRGSWYQVANRHNKKGWIQQEKLARTIAPSGLPAALPDTQHGDYLAQQGRIGFALGQQGDAETATLIAGFRLFSFVGAELEYGQIFGTTIDGSSYGANLLFEPIQSWSFTPFISTGFGRQSWKQKEKLNVGNSNEFNSEYTFIGGGINYYIGYNFVVRGEYRQVSLTGDNDSLRNSAWRIGFSSFF